jgi:hypothetical protein
MHVCAPPQAKLLYAVSQTHDDDADDEEDNANLDFDEFLMALASIAVFLNPSPFITPAVKTQRFLHSTMLPKAKRRKVPPNNQDWNKLDYASLVFK